ncbi:MAG: DUF1343 domain-containing protein [Clostridia bacterium]|nr:DUF1343 domain-containing protein [Clostridia bacterium]
MRAFLSGLDSLSAVDALLRGRRIGLMTNQTGVDRSLRHSSALLSERYDLTALFAVEHGIRGDIQAGERLTGQADPATGVPVYAVYGGTHRLTAEMLNAFDVLCFDMQDVGARFYTYLYALSFAMEACAEADKPVIVFDRINPLGGTRTAGTVLDERFASYIGMYPLPTRYGLTIGEYALWVKAYLGLERLKLTVVPLTGWRRSDRPDGLKLTWIAPSPNCPTLHAAECYIGACVFEGTNVSEGRGTTLPFEYIGAPWIDALELEARLNAVPLPGVRFRACWFTPTFSKYAGERCAGVQMHITDRDQADAVEAALTLLDAIRAMYPEDFRFLLSADGVHTIDKILGTDSYRLGMHDARSLLEAHAGAREAFRRESERFMLYR